MKRSSHVFFKLIGTFLGFLFLLLIILSLIALGKFLYFPEENHWVLSPQNGILWQREFFAWLDQWLKP